LSKKIKIKIFPVERRGTGRREIRAVRGIPEGMRVGSEGDP